MLSHNTSQTTNVYLHPPANSRTSDAIQFFRKGSTNYRRAYDAAAGARTPGTGRWFLTSPEHVDWEKGKVLNLICTGALECAT